MLRRWQQLWFLIGKDLQLFACDRRAAMLCFVVPICLASLFSLVFDGPGQRMGQVELSLLIVIEDDSVLTQQIQQDLQRSTSIDAKIVDRVTAAKAVRDRQPGVVIILEKNWAQTNPQKPHLQIWHHPLCALESQWAEGLLTEIILKRLAKEMLEPMGLSRFASLDQPIQFERATYPSDGQHPFNVYSHSFAGMTLQYLLFWGMESGLLFLRERRRGIWKRLRTAPVPLTLLWFSRVGSTSIIAAIQVLTTFLFGYLVFGVTITGSILGFLLLVLALSLLSAATGMLVASFSGTEARARSLSILVILLVSLFGGLWLPAFLLPSWVQQLALSLPTTWAMRGLDGVTWQGMGIGSTMPCVYAVFGFTVLFLGLSAIKLYRLERAIRQGVPA